MPEKYSTKLGQTDLEDSKIADEVVSIQRLGGFFFPCGEREFDSLRSHQSLSPMYGFSSTLELELPRFLGHELISDYATFAVA